MPCALVSRNPVFCGPLIVVRNYERKRFIFGCSVSPLCVCRIVKRNRYGVFAGTGLLVARNRIICAFGYSISLLRPRAFINGFVSRRRGYVFFRYSKGERFNVGCSVRPLGVFGVGKRNRYGVFADRSLLVARNRIICAFRYGISLLFARIFINGFVSRGRGYVLLCNGEGKRFICVCSVLPLHAFLKRDGYRIFARFDGGCRFSVLRINYGVIFTSRKSAAKSLARINGGFGVCGQSNLFLFGVQCHVARYNVRFKIPFCGFIFIIPTVIALGRRQINAVFDFFHVFKRLVDVVKLNRKSIITFKLSLFSLVGFAACGGFCHFCKRRLLFGGVIGGSVIGNVSYNR